MQAASGTAELLVNTIAFALSDRSRLTCAMQYVFLLTSNDSLPLHAQDGDLSLKLAVVGTGNCRGVVSPEKANLHCCVLKALILP